jgi:hypothetical protein
MRRVLSSGPLRNGMNGMRQKSAVWLPGHAASAVSGIRGFADEVLESEEEKIKRNQELITSELGRFKRKAKNMPMYVIDEDYGPPHENRLGSLPIVYSKASMLHEVTQEDVSKWYLSRKEDTERLPESLRHCTNEVYRACLSDYLMIRQPTYDVLQALKEIQAGAEDNASGKSVAFHGPRGTGKSISLNLLAQYALQNNWLVIGTRGEDFAGDKLGFIYPSKAKPNIYSQDRYAREWCRKMLKEQGDKLRKIKLKRSYSYTWKSPLTGPESKGRSCDQMGVTVHDLFTQALIDTSTAANIVYDFVEELKIMEPSEGKVLVLMDNINVWDQGTKFRSNKATRRCLRGWELSMVDAFRYFMRKGPVNGMSAWAITCAGYATLTQCNAHIRHAHFEVRSGIYSDDELMSAISHYKASKILTSEVDAFLVARMKGLTGSVPKDLHFDAVLL